MQNYRINLMRNAANFKPADRVAHFANAVTWKVFDAGHNLNEAFGDFDVMARCVEHFLEAYPVDGLIDSGIRHQFNVPRAFGEGYYYHDDEVVGIKDHAHCTPDTLMEYLDDTERYIWEKLLPAKYPDWENKDISIWQKSFDEYIKYVFFILRMGKLTAKYGIPSMAPNNPMKGSITFAVEELEANLLGIKGLSLAMRRDEGLIEEFVNRWDEQYIAPVIEKVKKGKGPNYKYCFDASLMMLAHNIMNPKQFEKFYYPYLKKLLDAYAEKKMNVRIFTEGSIMRFADYFADIPRGVLTLHIENDDAVAIRRALPNVAIMGGLTGRLLSEGSPEMCVDRVKYLIDELKEGFILSEDKMLSYRNDAKSENFKAVCEYVEGL